MSTQLNLVDTRAEAFARLTEFIKDDGVALLTSTTADGTLRSRPLTTREVDQENRALWFLVASNFGTAESILHARQVALVYASPSRQCFASACGRAEVVHDRAKARELWVPPAETRFPTAADDPRLVLLRVDVTGVEFWDAP